MVRHRYSIVATSRRAVAAAILAVGVAGAGAHVNPAPASAQLSSSMPALTGAVTGSGSGAPAVQHDGAPTPTPFTTDYLVGFPSDVSSYQYGVYWEVVRMFDHVKTQQPIMDENLEKAIAINNAAADDPALIKRAQQDAAADTDGVMLAVSDALGEEFGAAFRDAL
ncbi:hypothetical protein ACL1CA_07955 [Corynebacterium striatum]